jgi:hypothetical protein
VLRDNSRARAFYGSNGFADDAGIEKTVRLGGVDLLEVRLRNQIGGSGDVRVDEYPIASP